MTRIEELQKKAVLHRQAGTILREDAKHHDEAARMIDGGLSEWEETKLKAALGCLLATILLPPTALLEESGQ